MDTSTRRFASAVLGLCALLAGTVGVAEAAARGDRPRRAEFDVLTADRGSDLWHGQPVSAAAKADTVYLLGGPDRLDGKFQDAHGQPAWHGWTTEDATFVPGDHWSVTAEPDLVINGHYSLWCGIEYPEPGPIPIPGFGYGNNWRQNAVFTHTVADNTVASNVVWSLLLQYDTEPTYDFVYLQWHQAGQWVTLEAFDGQSPGAIAVEHAFQVRPEDYVGPGADRIELRIRFTSDGAWSDWDGLWPTERGACQVDDIAVSVNGTLVSFADFEDGAPGDWTSLPDPGVGDFAALYTHLGDLDPCRTNWSSQVAFVDNDIVVPGTGGTWCITWCYGPGGYIVNNTGGLLGEGHWLNNRIVSPPLEKVPQLEGAFFAFDVYVHEELGAYDVWPGVFYNWGVRSIATGDPADLLQATWRDRSFVDYGGPEYRRRHEVISDLLHPAHTHLQVSLNVMHLGWIWGWVGIDGTPAPYFDNVAVAVHGVAGPSITARTIDLAQDSFPAQPYLDFDDLASNAVRFDMARNIAPPAHLINRPGDSLIVDVRAVRAGTELVDAPRMHVAMKANPVFDGVRVLPPGFTRTGDLVTGWVHGDTTYGSYGGVMEGRWNFDLPDEDFFYPGDVIHYYFEAEDSGGGVTTLPGDLAGFGNFADNLAYPGPFAVRALPKLFAASPHAQPRLLVWDDSGGQGLDKWLFALRNSGFGDQYDYDLYQTNGPTSGVGNGLGGRASVAHLDWYRVLVYTSGDLASRTLSNGDPNVDPGDDIGLLSAWLDSEWPGWFGSRGALMCGDNLVHSLEAAGPSGQAFIADHLGVSLVNRDVRPFISGQTMPLVRAIPGNDTFWHVQEWIANGGCPRINTMDALLVTDAQRLAEFTNPNGQSGVYPFAAATRRTDPVTQATVILLPYDLPAMDNPPGYLPPAHATGKPARAVVLGDVLGRLGFSIGPPLSAVPDAEFTASNHPNPLNPATTIALSVPHPGPVRLAVYNLRGALVQTLVDERLPAGRHEILWDGRDARGAQVASGVYFYEARHGGEVKVGKMMVVK